LIGRLDRRVLLATAAALVVVVLLWYLALWNPREHSIATEQANLSAAQQLLQQYENELANIRSGTGVASAQAQAGLLQQAIPPSIDLPGILNDIFTAATLAGVGISTVTPATPGSGGVSSSGGGSVQQEHLSLSTSGRYFQIVDFVDQLQQLPRVYVITSLNISGGAPQQPTYPATLFTPTLTAAIAATTFYTGTPPATAASAPSSPQTTVVPGSTATTAGVPQTTVVPGSTATSPSQTTVVPSSSASVTNPSNGSAGGGA
jgi:Tfp pilus assembly protein PilO